MKVLYVITVTGHGRGGHAHSLDHISRALAYEVEVGVVSIGVRPSPVISANPHFRGHIPFNSNPFLLNTKFRELFGDFDPDLIHCFDPRAYLALQLLPVVWSKPMVLNRCGGPNPKKRFCAVVDTMILFSKENYEWYCANAHLRKGSIHLIPNRVNTVDVLPEGQRIHHKVEGAFCFVRISRIGRDYLLSLRQALQLMRELSPKHRVHLYIIGVVEDKDVMDALRIDVERDSLPVTFIVDDSTVKASQLLYLADAVIGTGRGVMEAMSLGLPVLAPVRNAEHPVLVDADSFDALFASNFSERGELKPATIRASQASLERILVEPEYYRSISAFTLAMYRTYFDIATGVKRYLEVYKNAMARKKRLYIGRNSIHIIRCIIQLRNIQREALGQ